MNCLRPLITHSRPSFTARVCMAASGTLYGSQRSEAPRGSVRQCASRNCGSSTMRGNQRSCRWRGARLRSNTETFQICTSLSASPESPRAISSAMIAKVWVSVALSNSRPPNSSGTPRVRMPTFWAPSRISGASRSSGTIFHSRCQLPRMNGITSLSTNSRQLCRIMRCSSESTAIATSVFQGMAAPYRPREARLNRAGGLVALTIPRGPRYETRARARRGEPMDELDELLEALTGAWTAVAAQVATIWVPIQLVLIALAALAGWGVAALIRKRVDFLKLTASWPAYLRTPARTAIDSLGIIATIVLLISIYAGMRGATLPSRSYLIGVAANLATAWVVIAVLASVIYNQLLNRLVSIAAWSMTALSILGLLDPVENALDSAGVVVGGLRITALIAIKATVLLLLALWAATATSNFLDRRLRSYPDLTPSIQVLLGKLVRIGLITFAVLVVLSSVGIDFSALALFSGAVGVGVREQRDRKSTRLN